MRGRLRAALSDATTASRRAAARRGRVPALHVLARRQPARYRAHATRRDALFERLLGLRNDVGLLAEEYDPRAGRLVGNFPQAFTHIALVNTALLLSREPSSTAPAEQRAQA